MYAELPYEMQQEYGKWAEKIVGLLGEEMLHGT